MPPPAARVEEVGPFTLFVGTGPWPYYARPPEVSATIRIVDADDDLATIRAVQDVSFSHGGTATGPQGIAERDALQRTDTAFLRDRIASGASVMAVAELAGEPVAAGMHQPVGSVTEIVGVATLPAVRRQGLGGAVTGALVEHALAQGIETVFLSAGSQEISQVYARLGFRRIGTACIAG